MMSTEDEQRYRCVACGRIGCWTQSRQCPFHGRSRSTHVDASMGDNVPHMFQRDVQVYVNGAQLLRGASLHRKQWGNRDVIVQVDSISFRIGTASGSNMNCLIDTLRQLVAGGVDCDVQHVRNRLECQFRSIRPGDFLDLQHHWRAVIGWLARLNANNASFQADNFKLVCIDLFFVGHGDVVGDGLETLYLAREDANHFVPLIPVWDGGPREGAPTVSTASSSTDKPPQALLHRIVLHGLSPACPCAWRAW